jgi:hypothetical protein
MIQPNKLATAGNDTRITQKIAYSQLLRNRKFKLVENVDTNEYYLGQVVLSSTGLIPTYIKQIITPDYIKQLTRRPLYIKQLTPDIIPTYIDQFILDTESNPTTFIQQYDKELFVPGRPKPNISRPVALFHQYSAGQIWFK